MTYYSERRKYIKKKSDNWLKNGVAVWFIYKGEEGWPLYEGIVKEIDLGRNTAEIEGTNCRTKEFKTLTVPLDSLKFRKG